jgi:uncharacterized protein YggE
MHRPILGFGILAVLAGIAWGQGMAPAPPPRLLNVSGTAERQVPPDQATIILAVQSQAETVAAAVADNSRQANAVTTAINRLGITGLTVRTLSFDVSPLYEMLPPTPPPTRVPRIVGYQVTNRLEVRLTQPDTARLSADTGRVLDAALAAGANRVDEVRFGLANTNPALRGVLADATRDARATAQTLAAAAGVTLGPLQTLSATPYFQPPMPLMARAAAADAATGVPIQAGPLTVRATVQAVYLIK